MGTFKRKFELMLGRSTGGRIASLLLLLAPNNPNNLEESLPCGIFRALIRLDTPGLHVITEGILPMNRRIGLLSLCILMVIFGLVSPLFAEETRPGIVVWRIEDKSGVSVMDIESLSGYLDAEVEKYSGMQVVSQADIETVLRGEETRQKCGSEDSTSCMAEIGAALGVPEAVSGDLGRVGDIWILNLRRVNIRAMGVIKRVSRQAKGETITAMVEALSGAVEELFEVGKEPLSTYQIAAYSTFFPGLALIAIGGIGSWQMQEAWNDHKVAPVGSSQESDAKDRHATWKGVSTAMYVIGGAAMATGITLWIVDAVQKDAPTEKDEADDTKPEVNLLFGPSNRGMALGVFGRW